MPHDAKGQPLAAGDIILIPFKITQVMTGEDYCNLSLESLATMAPEHKYPTTLSAINAKQVIRANEGDDVGFLVLLRADGGRELLPNPSCPLIRKSPK